MVRKLIALTTHWSASAQPAPRSFPMALRSACTTGAAAPAAPWSTPPVRPFSATAGDRRRSPAWTIPVSPVRRFGDIEHAAFEAPAIGQPDALLETVARLPAEATHAPDVEEFSRRAVRLAGVEDEPAVEADDARDELGKLPNGDIAAAADVAKALACAALHEQDAGACQVVDVQELPARRPRSPQRQLPRAFEPRQVRLAQQRGKHMAGQRVEVVMRTVEVGRHHRYVARPVLRVERLAQLQSRYFRHRVRLVGALQGTGKEVFLLDRLRAVPR